VFAAYGKLELREFKKTQRERHFVTHRGELADGSTAEITLDEVTRDDAADSAKPPTGTLSGTQREVSQLQAGS
jgi:hypothetical protein